MPSNVPEVEDLVQDLQSIWEQTHQSLLQLSASTKTQVDKKRRSSPVLFPDDKVWLSSTCIRLKITSYKLGRCFLSPFEPVILNHFIWQVPPPSLMANSTKVFKVSFFITGEGITTVEIEMQERLENNNNTTVFLLGFLGLYTVRIFLFLLIFMTYCVTICGNLMVIILVSYSRNLHSPMYFFLTQLTTSDMMTTSTIVPQMLHGILNNGSSMSLMGCISQFFFFSYPECVECLLLTVMSYDRYLAICKPLNYHSMMNPMLCLKSIILSWLLSFIAAFVAIASVSQLSFCKTNVIDHFFCDLDPILDLSCSDTFSVKLYAISVAVVMVVLPFVIIVISYASIIRTILKIQSINQKKKAFSTCGSHLAVVSIFYGTLFTTYLAPVNGRSTASHKIPSVMYCLVTPLINPVIYCLRNKDIKIALRKFIK
ncbi:olfactory receptor 1468-like [Engystomops pustulosus]|uniref:olfactory receptor 1468-like n=1 Tax=Engystomops pustulosus TaxID=76066 RepID=UPI003AFACB8E